MGGASLAVGIGWPARFAPGSLTAEPRIGLAGGLVPLGVKVPATDTATRCEPTPVRMGPRATSPGLETARRGSVPNASPNGKPNKTQK